MNLHPDVETALRNFDSFEIPSAPPKQLALLNTLRKLEPDREAFADIDVLFIQHHLGPFIARVDAMFEDGLAPERCWFVDIPYSTHDLVRSLLRERGCPSDQASDPFNDPLANYSDSQASRVSALMNKIANRNDPRPLLVIDDGAYFVRYLNDIKDRDPRLLSAFHNCSVVEQTTRGHRYICDHSSEVVNACRLSIVTIARCKTKKEFEGPFIGAAVSRALTRAVGKERISDLRNVALIGYGTVGQATVREILSKAPKATLDVVDIDPRARENASSISPNCQGISQLGQHAEYELVVGCTGYNSIHLEQRAMLADGAILASGSSAAIEFNRAGFIDLANQYPDDEIKVLLPDEPLKQGIHANITFQQEGGKVFSFLNAGFPVNFDGRLECLPVQIIQATHCLLDYASRQALKLECPGIYPIDPMIDGWILQNAIKELSLYGSAQDR